jgi:hypothetical protein
MKNHFFNVFSGLEFGNICYDLGGDSPRNQEATGVAFPGSDDFNSSGNSWFHFESSLARRKAAQIKKNLLLE